MSRRATAFRALIGVLGWALAAFCPAGAAAAATDSLTVTIRPGDSLPPTAITDLTGLPGAEGQLLLQWTAPDGNLGFGGGSAAAYQVKLASFSADSVGSTTSWWSGAAEVVGEPVPSGPGALDSLLLNALEPGATYWAAIKSSDAAGNTAEIDARAAAAGQQAFVRVFDAVPPAPANLVLLTVTSGTVSLDWDPVSAGDLDFYRVYVDSVLPYDFGDAFVVAVDSPGSAFLHEGLAPATTYAYRVTAVDKGAPGFAGQALESPPSNAVSTRTLAEFLVPAPVTDLRAVPGGTDGQITLSWTEPGDDEHLGRALVFLVRASTVANIANDAEFAAAQPLASFSATPIPVPSAGLAPVSFTVNGLTPSVTYYFAVRAVDDDAPANTGSWLRDVPLGRNATNFAAATDLTPAAPAGLAAAGGGRSVALSWSANTEPDIAYYRIWRDSEAPADNFIAYTTATGTSFNDTGLVPATSYFYRLRAVDSGPLVLESALTPWVTGFSTQDRVPLPPYGLTIAASASSATVTWLPVTRYADGGDFLLPAAPAFFELNAYRVYRATAALNASWNELARVATGTWRWDDPAAPGANLYYMVRSENPGGLSELSMVRGLAAADAWVVAPDSVSVMQLSLDAAKPFEEGAQQVYRVGVSSHGEDLQGRVLKSLEFTAYRDGTTAVPNFELQGMGLLRMRFEASGGVVTPSGLGARAAASPDQVSVYWHNGEKWVQLYGKLDAASQTMTLQTKYLGKYQLRAAERTSGFNFDAAGISNKSLTPNADGFNDSVVFTFDNPRDSQVTGRVFDLEGREVAMMTPGPIANSLVWDGKSNGQVVPGGVYLYQLESENLKFTGTVIVIK